VDEHRLHLVDDEAIVASARSKWRFVGRILFFVFSALSLYVLAPQLLDVWEEAPRIEAIGWVGLASMLLLEGCSFFAVWQLQRIIVPELDTFSAATAQLSANAVSRAVPGGAAIGAGVHLRLWTVAGVTPARAATGMATTSLISTATLLALPVVSLLVAAVGAPVPSGLASVAIGGALLSFALFGFGAAIMIRARFAERVAGLVHRIGGWIARRIGRVGPSVEDLLERRTELIQSLGPRWRGALGASVANWGLDYLVLVAALQFLGADPRFSVVLLAYGAAAVLAMIPITPGGVGFVEAGLTSLLVVAGVPARDALLATLAYRITSFWLPLPAGLVAWVLFRRRYERRVQ
jgi:uncharacterized membrane protein YbhN (UPF0104 family)